MSLYTTRNPHKTALRHHHYDAVQPAEKQPHPSDPHFLFARPHGQPSIVEGMALFLGPVAIMVALLWSIAG